MTPFTFVDAISPEENIRAFFEHLREVDEELAHALEGNIDLLFPSRDSRQRRTEFNSKVQQFLDSLDH